MKRIMKRMSILFLGVLAACAASESAPSADAASGDAARSDLRQSDGSLADAAAPFAHCPAPPALAAGVIADPSLLAWDPRQARTASCAWLAFDPLVANARVICSGVNVHGVVEAEQFHAALLRYLVLRHNVRVIAVEMDLARMDAWQRALEASDEKLLEGHLQRQHDVSFFRSILALRRESGAKLRFAGFDIAVTYTDAVADALAFLDRVDSAFGKQIAPALRGTLSAARAAAEQIKARIAQQRATYEAVVGADLVERQLWNLDNYIAAIDFTARQGDDPNNFWVANADYREPRLFTNMQRIIGTLAPGEKVAMVTNNLHCAENIVIGTNSRGAAVDGVGTAVRKVIGPAYVSIAQLYGEGKIADGVGTGRVDYPQYPGSLEIELLRNGAKIALLPTSGKPLGIDLDRPWYTIYGWEQKARPLATFFDAIGWIRTVTANLDR